MARAPRRSGRENQRDGSASGRRRTGDREEARQSRRDSFSRRDTVRGRGADARRQTMSTRRGERGAEGRRGERPERGGRERRRMTLPPDLMERIERDPLFQIVTLDGLTWIDPYTGSAIPIDENAEKTAAMHLQRVPSYKDQNCMPMSRLLYLRWTIDVERMIPHDPRLRLFGKEGRGWLNPFSGAWMDEVNAPQKNINRNTIAQIAALLSQCPYAAQGVFKEDAELSELLRQRRTHEDEQAKEEEKRREEEQHADADLKRAVEIQTQAMGKIPEIPNYEFAVHYEGYSQVSGDFYTVIPLDETRFFIMLGDVTGHGVQAALVVSSAMKTLRLITRSCSDLVEIVTQLNDEIKADLLSGQFITGFAAVLDTETDELNCILAGHHPCLLINLHKEVVARRIGQKGMAMGLIGGKLFQNSLRVSTIQLDEGDCLVQYSDGIIEAMDDQNEEYGHFRVISSIINNYDLPPEDLVTALADEVKVFSNNDVGDDLTMIALSIPLPVSEEEDLGITEVEADTASDVLKERPQA